MRHLWLSSVLVAVLLVGCNTTQTSSEAKPSEATAPAVVDPTQGLSKFTSKATVNLETSKGTIILEVDGENAPVSAGNFIDLVKRGFYNGLSFHRVVPGFVIQGGDPNGNGTGGFIDPVTKKERTIPLEIKLTGAKDILYGQIADPNLGNPPPVIRHNKGALAWARSSDPNSASSQFYITLADTSNLDGAYAVFGRVVSGTEVVEKIAMGDTIVKATLLETSVPATP